MPDGTLLEQLEQTLGTQYTIERELGGGGMSQVFLATELSLGRKVVIKVLPQSLAATVNVERFRREIQLAAQLQHPLIVPVLSSGIVNGLPYYTMPFIEGESLRARLSRDRELPLGDTVRILRDVVSALSYAHEKGVVHRDIKPDNVMLTRHHAVVTDFGVAKALSASTNPGNSLTSMGVALGTPAYMSPEQATADPTTDHRADIYAVGATAYEMITGRQLFSGRSPQAMLAAQAVEAPEPIEKHRPSVSPVLSALVMRTLEKHAADRPQSADEMIHVLDALATPSGGMTPTMSQPAAPAKRLSKRMLIASAAALAVIATGGYAATRMLNRPVVTDPNKVIVAPFQNKSGDARYDQLSTLATDWVSRGIVETGVVDIGNYTPAKDASGKISEAAYEVPTLIRQARLLSSGRIVSGSFYVQGDSIQFQAQIIDTEDGKLIGSIPPSVGLAREPMPAINQMRARVMGALAQMSGTERSGLSSIDAPPSYEAFKEFTRGQEAFDQGKFAEAVVLYTRAHELDTSYFAPLVRAAYAFQNDGNSAATDSLGKILNSKRDRLSDYEGYYLDRVLAWTRGDWTAAYVAAKQIARIAPKSSSAAYIAARSAAPINRLNEAAAAFKAMDIKKPHTWGYYRDYSRVLHILGKYDDELEIVRMGRKAFPDRVILLVSEVQALSGLNRPDEVRRTAELALTMREGGSSSPTAVVTTAARELLVHGHTREAAEIAEEAIRSLQRLTSSQRGLSESLESDQGFAALETGRMMLIAGHAREAKVVADSLVARNSGCIPCLSLQGQVETILGNRPAADQAIEKLLSIRRPYLRGASMFGVARIQAQLGLKAESVRTLREAISSGTTYEGLHTDPAFLNLKGYEPFEELRKPVDGKR